MRVVGGACKHRIYSCESSCGHAVLCGVQVVRNCSPTGVDNSIRDLGRFGGCFRAPSRQRRSM